MLIVKVNVCRCYVVNAEPLPESFQRGALGLCRGGLTFWKFVKSPLICSVSYFNLGVGALFSGLKPTKVTGLRKYHSFGVYISLWPELVNEYINMPWSSWLVAPRTCSSWKSGCREQMPCSRRKLRFQQSSEDSVPGQKIIYSSISWF